MGTRALRAGVLVPALVLALGVSSPAAAPLSIAVIAKGTREPFWQLVMQGAMKAARDYAVSVTFDGPEDESAVQQVDQLRAALANHPSAVCIDALDSAAVVPLLQEAKKRKIPVIGFDAGVNGFVPAATAATDNAAAAALAAAKLAALIGGVGEVGLIVGDPGRREDIDRRDGFISAMSKRYPGIRIVGPRYGGADPLKSRDLAKAMIQSDPSIAGFFGSDDGSALGIVKAVQELGRVGDVVVVGFGSGKAEADAVRGSLMAGAVTEDPFRLGYKAVEAAVEVLAGQRVPHRIDTGFHWYDRSNAGDPAIAALLDR
ncbi:MAG: substrate-binding domain-containing protein [Spirochaetia bacterium]